MKKAELEEQNAKYAVENVELRTKVFRLEQINRELERELKDNDDFFNRRTASMVAAIKELSHSIYPTRYSYFENRKYQEDIVGDSLPTSFGAAEKGINDEPE